MDSLALKLDIKKPSDWGKVTTQLLYESGASSILSNYYNGSLFACLKSVYPGF